MCIRDRPLSVYAPALDAGVITPASVIDDYPVEMLGGSIWPVNAYSGYRSIMTLQEDVYKRQGINPVRIYVEDEYIRAAPGLTGFTKCGGNYAASIKAGELAEEQGYAQVLWLDGVEKKYVEEVGSMNIMFKIDGKVYTAATVGTVLPGVTRRSCIELLKDWGYDVIELSLIHI